MEGEGKERAGRCEWGLREREGREMEGREGHGEGGDEKIPRMKSSDFVHILEELGMLISITNVDRFP